MIYRSIFTSSLKSAVGQVALLFTLTVGGSGGCIDRGSSWKRNGVGKYASNSVVTKRRDCNSSSTRRRRNSWRGAAPSSQYQSFRVAKGDGGRGGGVRLSMTFSETRRNTLHVSCLRCFPLVADRPSGTCTPHTYCSIHLPFVSFSYKQIRLVVVTASSSPKSLPFL